MNTYNNIFLALWMQYDQEFWSELRDIEKKLLTRIIVKGESIEDLSKEFNIHKLKLTLIFEAILLRIERNLGSDIAEAIRMKYDQSRASKRLNFQCSNIETTFLN